MQKEIYLKGCNMDYQKISKGVNSVNLLERAFSENPEMKDSEDFLFALCQDDSFRPKMYALFSERLRTKSSIVKKIVSVDNGKFFFEFATDAAKNNEDIAYFVIKENYENFKFISDDLKTNLDFLKNLVSTTYMGSAFLKNVNKDLTKDKEFTLLVMKKDPSSYDYIDDTMKNDLEIVWAAMFDSNLLYAPVSVYEKSPIEVRQNKEFFDKALSEVSGFKRERGHLMNEIKRIHTLAAASLKGDMELKKAVIKEKIKTFKKEFKKGNYGYAYDATRKEFHKFLDEYVQDFSSDKTIMKQIITVDFMQDSSSRKNAGQSFKILTDNLKSDKKFIEELMKATDSLVFNMLDSDMRGNKDFVKEFFGSRIKPEDLPTNLRKDEGFIFDLLETYKTEENLRTTIIGHVSEIVDKSLWSDRDFVLKYLPYDGYVLELLPLSMRDDKEIVKSALSSGHDVLQYADDDILLDKDIIIEALKYGGYKFISKIPMSILNDKEFMMSLTHYHENPRYMARDIMRSVPLNLKKDLEFCMKYVGLEGWTIEQVDDSIKYDKELLTAGFKSGAHIYKSIDISKLKEKYTDDEIRDITGSMYQYI